MRVLLAVLAVFSMCGSADAQIFRGKLFGRGQAQASNCPGGVCPTGGNVLMSSTNRQPGHWSYPGNLDSHLEGTHGVSTAGMSRQQKLNLHDSLHEGTTAPTYRTSAYGGSVVVRSAAVPTYGSTGSQVRSYGSAGSQVRSYGSAGSAPIVTSVTYGSSAVQVVAPAGVNFVPTEAAFFEVVTGTGFRAEAVRAVIEARKAGKITPREAMRLRVAFLSPAFAKNAEELAVVQMSASGENPEALPMNADGTINVAGINWEGLAKFLQAMIPLLLTMLKALGLGV